eukprot:CAMPEP_0180482060 /NCGR_PEP_ID=MMETSP1036_2-20121128/34691_1 /TAXON_ID=632150 /ORGANISM="Azadinium spinosum, Strain 3D9" /LENGTH=89 /DNA_ID=CAMNT_0022489783 /DNA_START=737 /DNA_END=1006 /DNA_ORIENTATION=-
MKVPHDPLEVGSVDVCQWEVIVILSAVHVELHQGACTGNSPIGGIAWGAPSTFQGGRGHSDRPASGRLAPGSVVWAAVPVVPALDVALA